MGKHHKNRDEKNNDRREEIKNQVKVPDDVKSFCKLKLKKFMKDSKWRLEEADGKKEKKRAKKEIKRDFLEAHIEYLPKTIWWAVTEGHRFENKEYMQVVKEKLYSPEFVKYLYKILKDDDEAFRNAEMLPIMYSILLSEVKQMSKTEGGEEVYDVEDVKKLILQVIHKKFKKMTSKGIPENQAFDYLCAIPTTEVLKSRSQSYYYCGRLLQAMYSHAEKEDVDPETIFKYIFRDPEGENIDNSGFIVQVLLERKEKLNSFNENQTAVFNKITTWAVDTLEGEFSRKNIDKIIRAYIHDRQNDKRGDSNRRIYLTNLSAEEYPNIASVVKEIGESEDLKKYL